MRKPLIKSLLILIFTALLAVGCGSRSPSPQTAHTKLTKHFHKYGKKYKPSPFGQHAVGRIEIVSVREIQKKLAEAEAYVALLDGPTYRIRAIFEKKTFGWKVISWENLGENTGQNPGSAAPASSGPR